MKKEKYILERSALHTKNSHLLFINIFFVCGKRQKSSAKVAMQ